MQDPLNINEILNLMKETNKEFDSQVYIPSLSKDVRVKTMNASHLKNIVKTSVEGIFANNIFNQTTFSIIKDILDPEVPLSTITNFDKMVIILQLRKFNVKKTLDVQVVNGDSTKTITLDLDKLINKIRKEKYNFEDQTILETPYEIVLCYPSIEHEFAFDRHFDQTRIKKTDENDRNALKELFGPLFIQELAQYVKTIRIKDQVFNLHAVSVSDRISIVEGLSGSLITKIIQKIDEIFGKQINRILKVEKEIDGEKYKGSIEMNTSIFT